jgi:hypothetical protein
MRDIQPALVVRDSEDGVLVSEADGFGLVLFAAYLSWGEAREAGKRTGARRVVAVETDPASMVEESAAQDVVVTKRHDEGSISAQIRAVRALAGRGPKIGVN